MMKVVPTSGAVRSARRAASSADARRPFGATRGLLGRRARRQRRGGFPHAAGDPERGGAGVDQVHGHGCGLRGQAGRVERARVLGADVDRHDLGGAGFDGRVVDGVDRSRTGLRRRNLGKPLAGQGLPEAVGVDVDTLPMIHAVDRHDDGHHHHAESRRERGRNLRRRVGDERDHAATVRL